MHNGLVQSAPMDAFTEVAWAVDGARARLPAGPRCSPQDVWVAMRLLGRVSDELAALVAEQLSQQSIKAPELLAVRERFDSHLLAASVLEDSEASSASALQVLHRGLDRLAADLRACSGAPALSAL